MRGGIMLWGFGVAALLVVSIVFHTRTASYRYKITVEVETPQGLRMGSAVHEIEAAKNIVKFVDGDQGYVSSRGEAVAVDLPGGQTLFALLTSPGEESLIPAVQSAFDPNYDRGAAGNIATARKMARASNGTSAELKRLNSFEGGSRPFYPLLVRFGDINDPASIEKVEPATLDKSFGAGVRLGRITVEITDEPVSDGIRQRLPWLSNFPEPSLKPGHKGDDWSIAATVHHGDFKRAFRK